MASDLKANAAPRQKEEGGEHGALHYAVDNASRQAQLQICQLRARRKVSSSTGDEYASCVCHVGSTEGVRWKGYLFRKWLRREGGVLARLLQH